MSVLLIIVVVSASLIAFAMLAGSPRPLFRGRSYYKGDDCPYMSTDCKYCEQFLQWVWDNRNRIEVAFLPDYHSDDDYILFVTTPYVLEGWMFLSIWKNGIDLFVAKDIRDFGRSPSQAKYCPNWTFVSTYSKRLWLKLYKWYSELNANVVSNYGITYVNPKLIEE